MINCHISDVEYYLPPKILTNENLKEFVDISPEYLEEKLGISQRHFMDDGETTSSVDVIAGKVLIKKINIHKGGIDSLTIKTCLS